MSKTRDIKIHPQIIIPGDIPPHPRPRVGKHGAYYPTKYKAFQTKADFVLRSQWRGREPIDNALEVEIFFLCTKPKSKIRKSTAQARLPKSKSRYDIDNQIKSVLDALQEAGIIKNDNLVYSISAEAWYGGVQENIETRINITEVTKAKWTII